MSATVHDDFSAFAMWPSRVAPLAKICRKTSSPRRNADLALCVWPFLKIGARPGRDIVEVLVGIRCFVTNLYLFTSCFLVNWKLSCTVGRNYMKFCLVCLVCVCLSGCSNGERFAVRGSLEACYKNCYLPLQVIEPVDMVISLDMAMSGDTVGLDEEGCFVSVDISEEFVGFKDICSGDFDMVKIPDSWCPYPRPIYTLGRPASRTYHSGFYAGWRMTCDKIVVSKHKQCPIIRFAVGRCWSLPAMMFGSSPHTVEFDQGFRDGAELAKSDFPKFCRHVLTHDVTAWLVGKSECSAR